MKINRRKIPQQNLMQLFLFMVISLTSDVGNVLFSTWLRSSRGYQHHSSYISNVLAAITLRKKRV